MKYFWKRTAHCIKSGKYVVFSKMDQLLARRLLFLIGCMGTRLSFVWIAANVSVQTLQYLGWLALLPFFGFLVIYTFDLRKSGSETIGAPIWWNHLRLVHACLYGLFALFALFQQPNAYVFLWVDVCIGFIAFLHHHFGVRSTIVV